MLTFSLAQGRAVVIDGDIFVTFMGFDGRRAILGILASDEIEVLRLEVAERDIEDEGLQADIRQYKLHLAEHLAKKRRTRP